MKILKTFFAVVYIALFVSRASALIVSGTGQPPLHGCPDGAAAACSNSVAWWEGPPFGGGEWHALFRGDTEKFSATLTRFAAIRSTNLQVVLHAGPKFDPILEVDRNEHTNTLSRIDWELVVCDEASLKKIYAPQNSTNWQQFIADNPNFKMPETAPRLHVYLGGESGGVDWKKVSLPANVRVRDERKMNSSESAK